MSFKGTGTDPIIDKAYVEHVPPAYQYHLGVTGDKYSTAGYARFHFRLGLDDVQNYAQTDSGFWKPGTWYFIVGTYDGSTIALYVDGEPIDSKPATGAMKDYGKTVRVGRFSGLNYYLPGTIDEVRIYDRALTPDEITWLYEHPGGTH